MTDYRSPLDTGRRSILKFLGVAAAESILAQQSLLSSVIVGRDSSSHRESDAPAEKNPTIGIDSNHQISYASGGVCYSEKLYQGQWIGSYLSVGVKPQEQPETNMASAFGIAISDKGGSKQQIGALVSGDWQWVSASEVLQASERKRHCVAKLSNSKLPLALEIHTLLDGTPIFTRWLTLTNESKSSLALTELVPWCGQLWPGSPAAAIGVSQRWEYMWEGWFGWKPLTDGVNQTREDRGLVWDDPYFVLRNESTGEYAFGQLAWPANYVIEIKKEKAIMFGVGPTATNALRVIAPGETIVTPALHFGVVKGDFDMAVQSVHHHVRSSVLPANIKGRSHLIQYLIPEDWSMTVYRGNQYDETNMKKCIDVAAATGAEAFVLDGPMWCSAYGNWSVPNQARFPRGLTPLADYAHSKGILFGLYSETEGGREGYCSEPNGACIGSWNQSKVFQEHPEWFVQPRSVLNLSNPDAAAYMKSAVNGIIDQYQVDLFRHDFNAPQRGQGSETIRDGFVEDDYWRHYEAFFEIFRSVRQQHPNVILQQAAAGGARCDLATVGVFDEQFTSDRAAMPFVYRMLSGMSVFLPPETLVNASGLANSHDLPDIDTTLRGCFALGNTPMIFNAILPGSVEALTPEMRDKYLHYSSLYKEFIRPLLPSCLVYHHAPVDGSRGVDDGSWFAMEFISPDRTRGWATIIRLSATDSTPYLFKPKGLDRTRAYRVKFDSTGREERYKASELAPNGLPIRLSQASASELLLIEMES